MFGRACRAYGFLAVESFFIDPFFIDVDFEAFFIPVSDLVVPAFFMLVLFVVDDFFMLDDFATAAFFLVESVFVP